MKTFRSISAAILAAFILTLFVACSGDSPTENKPTPPAPPPAFNQVCSDPVEVNGTSGVHVCVTDIQPRPGDASNPTMVSPSQGVEIRAKGLAPPPDPNFRYRLNAEWYSATGQHLGGDGVFSVVGGGGFNLTFKSMPPGAVSGNGSVQIRVALEIFDRTTGDIIWPHPTQTDSIGWFRAP